MNSSDAQDASDLRALWLRECARRQSLRQLGITPFISRYDPPGARSVNRLLMPNGGEAIGASLAATETGEELGAQQLRALLTQGDGVTPSTDTQNESGPRQSPRTNPLQTINESLRHAEPLSLLFVNSGDVLWVEVLEDQLLRQEQLQLIAAMARAIRGPSVRCQHQQFDWPPAGQSALNAAQGGIADVLSGFVQRLTTDHGTEEMVLMGPCDCLPDSPLPSKAIPSSLDMLRNGALKQTAWDRLKPLCSSA